MGSGRGLVALLLVALLCGSAAAQASDAHTAGTTGMTTATSDGGSSDDDVQAMAQHLDLTTLRSMMNALAAAASDSAPVASTDTTSASVPVSDTQSSPTPPVRPPVAPAAAAQAQALDTPAATPASSGDDNSDGAALAAALAASASRVAISSDSAASDFVPSDEWQPIKAGQAIPPGLWVRMDLSTGVKMARLLPESERKPQSHQQRRATASSSAAASVLLDADVSVVAVTPSSESDSVTTSSASDATAATAATAAEVAPAASAASSETMLLGAPPDRSTEPPPPPPPPPPPKHKVNPLDMFRLNHWSGQVTEMEVIIEQLALCGLPSTTPHECGRALGIVEDNIHNVDNAIHVVTIDGYEIVLSLLTRSATNEPPVVPTPAPADGSFVPSPRVESMPLSSPIRMNVSERLMVQHQAAWLLGTGAQNNAAVQQHLLARGALPSLLSLLRSLRADVLAYRGEDGELQRARWQVMGKVVYALSALIRSNVDAQARFNASNGVESLRLVLEASVTDSSEAAFTVRGQVQRKLLALVHDLLLPVLLSDDGASAGSSFLAALCQPEWCTLMGRLLSSPSAATVERALGFWAALLRRVISTSSATAAGTPTSSFSQNEPPSCGHAVLGPALQTLIARWQAQVPPSGDDESAVAWRALLDDAHLVCHSPLTCCSPPATALRRDRDL